VAVRLWTNVGNGADRSFAFAMVEFVVILKTAKEIPNMSSWTKWRIYDP